MEVFLMKGCVTLAVIFSFICAAWGESGKITLDVENAGRLEKAIAVNRIENTRAIGKSVKGKFLFEDLEPGIYDIVLETDIGAIEGVNMKNYNDLGELEDSGKIGAVRLKDYDEVYNKALNMKIFETQRRIFLLDGHRKRIRVLVEKLMADKMSLSQHEGGQPITWRIEIWTYRFWSGGWLRDQTFELIQRKILNPTQYSALCWNYEEKLGGILVTDLAPALVKYTIPKKLSPKKGVVNGLREEPELKKPAGKKEEEESESVAAIE